MTKGKIQELEAVIRTLSAERDAARGCPHSQSCACAVTSRHEAFDWYCTQKEQLAALAPALRTLRDAVAQYDASQPYVFPALGRDVIVAVRALLAGLPPEP